MGCAGCFPQGIAIRSGLRALRNSFETILERRRDEISPRMRSILVGLYGDWLWLDDRIAAVGHGEAFDRGRDFAAWVGLVPRQFSTRGRTILGRITKRGSRYLRMLFVQAAKVNMMRPHRWQAFSFGAWLERASPACPETRPRSPWPTS
jgi:transposase